MLSQDGLCFDHSLDVLSQPDGSAPDVTVTSLVPDLLGDFVVELRDARVLGANAVQGSLHLVLRYFAVLGQALLIELPEDGGLHGILLL